MTALLVCVAHAVTQPRPKTPSDLAAVVTSQFKRWDADSSGKLTDLEIDRAIADAANRDKSAAALAALRLLARNKKVEGVPEELALSAVADFVARRRAGDKALPDLDNAYQSALARIRAADRRLFGKAGPTLGGIDQGRLGDCYCLAPLGAMVVRDPSQVRQMFEPRPDGTIRLAWTGDPVDVAPPTDGEIAVLASSPQSGTWVTVYEKAIGTRRVRMKDNADEETAFGETSKGGSTASVLTLITGHAVERVSTAPIRDVKATPEERQKRLDALVRKLTEARADNRLVCAGTPKTPTGVAPPGIVFRHAYAVLDFDPETRRVTLWNPHRNTFRPKGPPGPGHGYPTEAGVFRVPLAELVQFFSGFSIETGKPRKS